VKHYAQLVPVGFSSGAETGTGADYYIGPQRSGQNDREDCLSLEASGFLSEEEIRHKSFPRNTRWQLLTKWTIG